jgi:ABC-type Zn2+ transport system substrate-binding protein/surface adhesin
MAPRTSVPSISPFAAIARLRAAKPSGESPDNPEDEEDEEDDETGDDGDGKKKKTKKQKKAEDEQDEEDDGESEAHAARGREKARILAIMNSSAAQRSPTAALHVALHTSMPRHAAIKMLGAMIAGLPKNGRDTLYDRMASQNIPDIGADGGEAPGSNDPKTLAARIIRAGKKARGELKE